MQYSNEQFGLTGQRKIVPHSQSPGYPIPGSYSAVHCDVIIKIL